jgi:alpha-ribazole phosphatase
MRLILVRHGETEYNLGRRYQGQREVPLNQTGLEQAERLARRFAALQIDALFSSDLQRCVQTAAPIAKACGSRPKQDARWRELSFGEWEGMTYAEIQAASPNALAKWQADPVHASPPGGETLAQLAGRVSLALEELSCGHAQATVLLVTHAGVVRTLLCLALGLDLNRQWQFEVASASVSEIRYYGENAMVVLLNDSSHFTE